MSVIRKIKNRLNYIADQWRSPVTIKNAGGKKAILSYILHPFRNNLQLLHCNIIESIQMVEALSELGYSVDVVDYRNARRLNFDAYDLVIGLGTPFRNSFNTQKPIVRISYLTGANPNFSNLAEAKRLEQIYHRRGAYLQPRREVYWPWAYGAVNADGIIITGNDWTASTFTGVNKNIFTVPVPYVSEMTEVANTPIIRGFVWFSGHGAVHKGLDLALEAVSGPGSQFKLDVCGNITRESDFISCYRSELYKRDNVTYHGMINPNGPEMKAMLSRNAFVLFPSCSEGTASSVITCMAHGLIPIVTKESGIDLKGFGLEIKGATPEDVREAMAQATTWTEEEIIAQRKAVQEYVLQHHSAQMYKQKLLQALQSLLSDDHAVVVKENPRLLEKIG